MAYRNLPQGSRTRLLAFDGDRLLARGEADEVAPTVKRRIDAAPDAQILVFDDDTGRLVDIDYTGTPEDVRGWIALWNPRPSTTTPKPIAREVSLLPRHWEWLEEQPGGPSAALRRLVDAARKSPEDARRRAQEAAYRFVLTMAGDREGFEEATRALFAGDLERFAGESEDWPEEVRDRAREWVAASVVS